MMEVDVSFSNDNSEDMTHPKIIKTFTEIKNYKEKRIGINQNVIKHWKKKK